MFEIGDKVRVIKDYCSAKEGDEGIIKALPGKNGGRGTWADCYSVEFPAWECTSCGHSCGHTVPSGKGHWVKPECLELINSKVKQIVITHDGKTTLARLYENNKVAKSAGAKCSPDDDFDFAVGAKLAFERLMEFIPEDNTPRFDKSMLTTGRFGCMSDGDWFVVGGDKLIYERGCYDWLNKMSAEGKYSTYRVKCVVEANSFSHAKCATKVIWQAPDFDTKKVK